MYQRFLFTLFLREVKPAPSLRYLPSDNAVANGIARGQRARMQRAEEKRHAYQQEQVSRLCPQPVNDARNAHEHERTSEKSFNQHGPYSVMWISMFSARPLTGIHDEERAGKRSALRPPRGGRLAKSLPPPCWKYGILAPVLITFSRQRLTIGRQARAT